MSDDSPKKLRRILLIERAILWPIWALFLLMGVAFTLTITLILSNPAPGPAPDPNGIHVLFLVGLIMPACSISFFHGVRFLILRRARRRQWSIKAVAIAYPILKVVTWAACNGPVFFNLVICLIARGFLPSLPVAAAVWLLVALDPPLLLPFRRFRNAA